MGENYVYFALSGSGFDTDEITKALDIQSTDWGSELSKRSSHTWKISAEHTSSETVDVYQLSAQLVQTLAPKQALIVELIERLNLQARLQVVLTFSPNQTMPAIGFDAQTLHFLSAVSAFIDIDTYQS